MNPTLVYGLVACILLVSAPHTEHLPLWVSVTSALLLGWRFVIAYRAQALPPRWLLLLLTFVCVASIYFSYRTLGREFGVTLLIMLAALKLLELRTPRDATVVIYLSCFIIITNFFYSQSISTALTMFVTLAVILTVWIQLHTTALGLRPRLRIAAVLMLQAIPLTVILFLLFPRIQGPLWGLQQNAYATSGLDDTMSPGSLSRLALSEAVAFRVNFSGSPPLREQMYWRGPVLWNFDGRTWVQGKAIRSKPPQLDSIGQPADYTVTLEPHNKTWLFVLELPVQISIAAGLTDDFQLLQKDPVKSRLRYTARSQLAYRANATEDPLQLQRALRIPARFNPESRQLALEWRKSLASDQQIVRQALAYFNSENFHYTLEPPPLGQHSVDDFLFQTRRGFCEHYASSFVYLMRAAGIPARVVTGYQGAEYNSYGNYHIVRQSDAHAWAEVWLAERGWVRVDPTAAISPQRVQNGLAAAMPNSPVLSFLARTQSPWLRSLRFNLDALSYQWNQWVLGYDPERQFAFLTRMGMESISAIKMALSMLGGLALLVGVVTLFMLRRMAIRSTDVAQKLYLKYCRKLERVGVVRAAHEGAQDFAARACHSRPQQAAAIHHITALYLAARYNHAPQLSGAGQKNAENLRALRHAVASFKI